MTGWSLLLDENIDPKTASYLTKEGIDAQHVRDALWLGADDERDIITHAETNDLLVVTSDVSDFGALPEEVSVDVVILFDDTMPAYRIASALISMIDAYGDRESLPNREVLDQWA